MLLPRQLGKAKSSKTMKELFGKSRGVNLLAAARIFMFGARDVWFVVGLPVFLYAYGWSFLRSALPGRLDHRLRVDPGDRAVAGRAQRDGLSREVPAARMWAAILAAVPIILAVVML